MRVGGGINSAHKWLAQELLNTSNCFKQRQLYSTIWTKIRKLFLTSKWMQTAFTMPWYPAASNKLHRSYIECEVTIQYKLPRLFSPHLKYLHLKYISWSDLHHRQWQRTLEVVSIREKHFQCIYVFNAPCLAALSSCLSLFLQWKYFKIYCVKTSLGVIFLNKVTPHLWKTTP